MFRRDDRPGAVTRAAGQVPDSTGVDPVRFREVVGRFPTGVTSVSLDPVLVLVCVERDARLHDLVLAAGEWGVSVLAADQEGVSRLFAERGRSSADALRSVRHRYGELTGAVLLDGALATFECRTVAVHGGGDHIVLLGEVLGMELPRPEAGPLVYYRGGYRGLD